MDIRNSLATAVITGVVLLCVNASAEAYRLQRESGNGPCSKDGNGCNVYCNEGPLAGTMYWNGSVWTDGVKWDADMDGEARKIVAANGAACT